MHAINSLQMIQFIFIFTTRCTEFIYVNMYIKMDNILRMATYTK